jgi:molecular chaperone IbpA
MSRNKKVYKGYKSDFTIEKVSVGFDELLKVVDGAAADESAALWYPPYNIRKTSADEYVIDLEVTGYNKEDIVAKVEGAALIVTAPGKVLFEDAEGDDLYYHQGIFPGGELYAKFYIAAGLEVVSADYDDGIITFKFKNVLASKPTQFVPIGPFLKPADAAPFVPEYNSAGEVVNLPTSAPVRDEVTVTVDETVEDKPTVDVTLLDPMPQVVSAEVVLTPDAPVTDATVVLSDATYEVADDVTTVVVPTAEGESDIVVAIPTEQHDAAVEAGVDVAAVVADAISQTEVALPVTPAPEVVESTSTEVVMSTQTGDPVTVVVPDVLPQVVEATVEDGKVVLTDTSENIPTDAVLVPTVTAEGEHDIMVAVTPETQVKLDELGVTPADVSGAIVANESEVVALPEELPLEPSAPVEPAATETVPVVVDALAETPTVTVNVPTELPQIVEVTVDSVVPVVDAASETPQVEVTLSDATHEVVSDDATLHVIKTEEGKADIVVAVPAEVSVELEAAGVDVVQVVTDAVTEAAANPEIPVVLPEPVVIDTPVDITTEVSAPVEAPVVIAVPDVMPTVVEVTVEDTVVNSRGETVEADVPKVVFEPAAEVPADAVLTPIVTAEAEHDAVIAITPETQVKLDELGVTVEHIEEAVKANETEVVPVDTFSPGEVAPAPVVEEVVPVAEVAPEVVLDPVSTEVVAPVVEEAPVVELPVEPEPVAIAIEEAPVAEVVAPVETAGVPGLPGTQSGPAEGGVVVNVESTEVPTTEVLLPEVLPQIVEATVKVDETSPVDPASEVPQATITVEPALYEVSDDVHTEVIKTEEGKADIVVAIPEEDKRAAEAAGIDIVADIKAAIEATPEAVAPELPVALDPVAEPVVVATGDETAPTLEVTTPEVIHPVMVVETTDAVNEGVPAIELLPVSGSSIPEDHILVPVVTAEGQNDAMIAVPAEVHAELEAAGVDVAKEVGAALVEAEVEVAKPTE